MFKIGTAIGVLCLMLCLVGSSIASASSATLVIYDKHVDLKEYSQFLGDLEAITGTVSYAQVGEPTDLYSLGVPKYGNVVIFPTKARSLGPGLSAKDLLHFMEHKGNILALSSDVTVSEDVRSLAQQMGLLLAPRGYKLVDHFDSIEDSHSIVVRESHSVVANSKLPVLYQGSGAILSNNPLLIPVLTGPSTGYVYDSVNELSQAADPWVSGSQAGLVASFQTLGNARFTWIGSDKLLSDKLYNYTFTDGTGTGNREFASQLVRWTFQKKNVLSVDFTQDYAVESKEHHHVYRIGTDIKYAVGISEWDDEKSEWVPYEADDIQLEFTMLDPYYRLTLQREGESNSSAVYGAEFRIPDHHGVFTFDLTYRRPGYTFLEEKSLVTIRHMANDEFPRSWEIPNSYLYVVSSGSVMVTFIVFVVLFMFTSTGKQEKAKKAKKNN